MSDSSDEELSVEWVPYSHRVEWSDITPLEQDDGKNPVVVIAYSERFKEVYDYFRAILMKNEKSSRALDLTTDALRLNPANYTVWQYRRDILKYIDKDLKDELNYIEDVIKDNPKNYQVWHHRRVIVERLNDPSNELELTKCILSMDAKNYHAWQHRQWVIKTFDLFDNELNFVSTLISEDIRNNSAWNQRIFVLKNQGLTSDIIRSELVYTMEKIAVVKNNESSWNYLKGLLKYETGKLNIEKYPNVLEFCENLFNSNIRSPYLIAFLIDVYEIKCLSPNETDDSRLMYANRVYEYCELMSKEFDIIRRKYWDYIAEKLRKKLNNN